MLLVSVVAVVSDSLMGVVGVGMLYDCRELFDSRCLSCVFVGIVIGETGSWRRGVPVIPVRRMKSAGSVPGRLSSSGTCSSSGFRCEVDRCI
jgi:hypothetical protein